MRTATRPLPYLALAALTACATDPAEPDTAEFSASASASASVSVTAGGSAASDSATSDSAASTGATEGSTSDTTGLSGTTSTASTTAATSSTADDTTSTASATEGDSSTGPTDDRAFVHADLWSVWWNDRTRCGAERTFLEICQRRGDACDLYQAAVAACDPAKIVYGQVGPEKQGEALCQRGKYPDIGGCVASAYDFPALRFAWYGAEWQGNWPFATLKVFPAGADWTSADGELIALSNHPGAPQAAMPGIANHGLDYGCAMLGVTEGDDAYLRPFGGFAWVEVPTDQPLTLVAAAGSNFGGQPFQGCTRGAATQDPWISGAPAAQLGCVYVEEDMVFEPGKHYAWSYGEIVELDLQAPPPELLAGFALPEIGLDISDRSACAL